MKFIKRFTSKNLFETEELNLPDPWVALTLNDGISRYKKWLLDKGQVIYSDDNKSIFEYWYDPTQRIYSDIYGIYVKDIPVESCTYSYYSYYSKDPSYDKIVNNKKLNGFVYNRYNGYDVILGDISNVGCGVSDFYFYSSSSIENNEPELKQYLYYTSLSIINDKTRQGKEFPYKWTLDGDILEDGVYYERWEKWYDLTEVSKGLRLTDTKKGAPRQNNVKITYNDGTELETYVSGGIRIMRLNLYGSITELNIPDFWNMSELEIYPGTSINGCVFKGLKNLTTVKLPKGLTSINAFLFAGSGLKNINIPESVMSINDNAFSSCKNLRSITIPYNVKYISEATPYTDLWMIEKCPYPNTGAFFGCYFTKDSFINNSPLNAEENDYWGALIVEYITEDTLVVKNNVLIECISKDITSVTIPDSVISIGDDAFNSCSSLASVTIPDSVTSIGDEAFIYCHDLTSVTIPDSVTSIGDDTFKYCFGLTSVTIGNSVTSIGNRTFYNCSGLTSIIIPNSVTSIGDEAFRNCSRLTSVFYKGTEYTRQPYSQNSEIISALSNGGVTCGNYAFY